MKATTSALLMVMAAGAAMAQAAPPSQTVAPSAKKPATAAAKPMAAKPAVKPVAKPAATAKPATKPAAKAATPFARKPMTAAKKTVAKPAAAVVTPAARKVTSASALSGQRDPFVSPVVERTGTIGPACETGKKCLAIGTVVLRGIVKAPQGMIAVVENLRRSTYFLRENDPVFNGYVVKITPDSIVFRENVVDAAGKQSTRDVVKKVSAPVV